MHYPYHFAASQRSMQGGVVKQCGIGRAGVYSKHLYACGPQQKGFSPPSCVPQSNGHQNVNHHNWWPNNVFCESFRPLISFAGTAII